MLDPEAVHSLSCGVVQEPDKCHAEYAESSMGDLECEQLQNIRSLAIRLFLTSRHEEGSFPYNL